MFKLDNIGKIALRDLNLAVAPKGPAAAPELIAATVAELANSGISLSNPEAITEGFAERVPELIREVKRIKGQRAVFTPLFSGFPDTLPDFDDWSLRSSIARARLDGNLNPTDADITSAMDFTSLDWWPASSVPQNFERQIKEMERQLSLSEDKTKQYFSLKVVPESDFDSAIRTYIAEAFATPSSLRTDVRENLDVLIKTYGVDHVDPSSVKFRETYVLLLKNLWLKDPKSLTKTGASPTDILRLMADLTGADASLARKDAAVAPFPKLTRLQRRSIVNTLEKSPVLDQMFKYRDLWLKLARSLHVGDFKAPKLNAALAKLRTSRHDSDSLISRFEETFKTDPAAASSILSAEAPTLLLRNARRIAAALEKSQEGKFLVELALAAPTAPLKVTLSTLKQFQDNGETYPRVAFSKSGGANFIDRKAGHLAVNDSFKRSLTFALEASALRAISEKDPWNGEKIFISSALSKMLMPEQLRSTSDSLMQLERGSRIPVDPTKTIRLFVHWKEASERTDLDLSAIVLDKNFKMVSQVSYTNLANGAMTHSGDITSAPTGAEEFIDIDLTKVKGYKASWRYIAPVVYVYSGSNFPELSEATAGWMIRNDASSTVKTFDYSTVENVFTLSGSTRSVVPFLLDLEEDSILYVDTYVKSAYFSGSNTENSADSASAIVSAVNKTRNLRVNVMDLIKMHVKARGGEIVSKLEDATISFGTSDEFTFNAYKPERMITELL